MTSQNQPGSLYYVISNLSTLLSSTNRLRTITHGCDAFGIFSIRFGGGLLPVCQSTSGWSWPGCDVCESFSNWMCYNKTAVTFAKKRQKCCVQVCICSPTRTKVLGSTVLRWPKDFPSLLLLTCTSLPGALASFAFLY